MEKPRFWFAYLTLPGESSLVIHDRDLCSPRAGTLYLFHLEYREIRLYDWSVVAQNLRKLDNPEGDLISYALSRYVEVKRNFDGASQASKFPLVGTVRSESSGAEEPRQKRDIEAAHVAI